MLHSRQTIVKLFIYSMKQKYTKSCAKIKCKNGNSRLYYTPEI